MKKLQSPHPTRLSDRFAAVAIFLPVLSVLIICIGVGAVVYRDSTAQVERDRAVYGKPYDPQQRDGSLKQRIQAAQRARLDVARQASVGVATATKDVPMVAGYDPFGNPLNPDGSMVGGDPCAGHHVPEGGFKGPEWVQVCEDNDIPYEECEKFLEYNFIIGDGSIHPSFDAPPGCRP